jgi:hypothetical protein
MGIEPTLSAWEADVLPLNYTRSANHFSHLPAPVKGRAAINATRLAQRVGVRCDCLMIALASHRHLDL